MNKTFNTGLLAAALLIAAGPAISQTAAKAKPALSVNLVSASAQQWEQAVQAGGTVAAWQEAVVSAELSGLRLAEVRAQVGDRVRRGQLLASLASETVQAELAQSRAAAAEAQALLAGAQADAERVRSLQTSGSGALSAQQAQQYLVQEQAAKARFEAAQAKVRSEALRLAQTRIVAPDDGLIAAAPAIVGAVAQPGQELFRLIRKSRLEWRAELPSAELARLAPGAEVEIELPDGQRASGRLRLVGPTVDVQSRNGLAYIDLSPHAALRAGSFVRGRILLGRSPALALPQAAVQLRDGFAYVFKVGADGRVQQSKVSIGRRLGDKIELLAGLKAGERVVASGVGFLADGDLVRVVDGSKS